MWIVIYQTVGGAQTKPAVKSFSPFLHSLVYYSPFLRQISSKISLKMTLPTEKSMLTDPKAWAACGVIACFVSCTRRD